MVKIQDILSPIPPQAKESGNNLKERGIHRDGTKYLHFTAPSTEERHEAIEHINKIVQGMKMQSYDLEELSQVNTLLTR